MGKVNAGGEPKKRKNNVVILPLMETLKPLPEVVTIFDSPINQPKPNLKKYVSPLSLSWKRQAPIKDSKEASSATESSESQSSPEKQVSDSRTSTVAASSSPPALVASDEIKETHKLSESVADCESESETATSVKRSKKKRKRRSVTPAVADNILEDAPSSSITPSVQKVTEKEVGLSGFKKLKCSPEKSNANQLSDCIETIDLDMTNEIVKNVDKDVEFISFKKLEPTDFDALGVKKRRKSPKTAVDFVDLSCTVEGVGCASSTNDSVIVIDDDEAGASQKAGASRQTPQNQKNAVVNENVNPVTVAEMNKRNKNNHEKLGVLFKIKPNKGITKKKQNRRRRNAQIQNDICFLGTGISSRPPIPTNLNVGNYVPPSYPHHQNLPGSSAQNSQPTVIPQGQTSIYGNNFDNPNGSAPQTGLRPIVIDGSNVAMGHGITGNVFSSRGIEICVNYFLKRGHKVYCFIPLFRKTDPLTKDRHILVDLEKQGHLICTPSRFVGNNTITPYDDRYIVQIAAELGGIIVSRDNYRDLIQENPVFKETILRRTLMFTWVGDILMFPTDPFGRAKVTLEQMLRF